MSGKVWFTADQHFRHQNVLAFCGRPFSTIEEHDAALITTWQACVGRGDRVYVLGDFCWRGDPSLILNQLPGQLFLIRGNHDYKAVYKHPRWIWCHEWRGVEIEKQHIIMCHFPLATWPGNRRGRWMLHGHVHNGIGHDKLPIVPGRFDVGVDGKPGFGLWSFEELQDAVPTDELFDEPQKTV